MYSTKTETVIAEKLARTLENFDELDDTVSYYKNTLHNITEMNQNSVRKVT